MATGVGVADIDLDGKLDIVFTCEGARGKSGVMWLSGAKGSFGVPPSGGLSSAPQGAPGRLKAGLQTAEAREISGPQGTKYDLVELIDLDGDGDLDVLTCEEAENLGVTWYENPTRR